MKTILIILILISSNALANGSQFAKNDCEIIGTHMFKSWNIESLYGKNQYEMSIHNSAARFKQKAILNLNSLNYRKTGRIEEIIFVKKTGQKEMKLTNGASVNVLYFQESAECKKILMKEAPTTDVHVITNSYPQMPTLEKEYAKQYKAKLNAQKAKQKDQRKKELIKKEKSELLKFITPKGYKKFKKHGCYYIGGSTWRQQYSDNSQPPKFIQVDIFTEEFLVKYGGGSDYVKSTGKVAKNPKLPLYSDMGCKKIVNSNRTKKSRKKIQLKKKSESLYE